MDPGCHEKGIREAKFSILAQFRKIQKKTWSGQENNKGRGKDSCGSVSGVLHGQLNGYWVKAPVTSVEDVLPVVGGSI